MMTVNIAFCSIMGSAFSHTLSVSASALKALLTSAMTSRCSFSSHALASSKAAVFSASISRFSLCLPLSTRSWRSVMWDRCLASRVLVISATRWCHQEWTGQKYTSGRNNFNRYNYSTITSILKKVYIFARELIIKLLNYNCKTYLMWRY